MNIQEARAVALTTAHAYQDLPGAAVAQAAVTMAAVLDEIEQACQPSTGRGQQLAPLILSILNGERAA